MVNTEIEVNTIPAWEQVQHWSGTLIGVVGALALSIVFLAGALYTVWALAVTAIKATRKG